jgi:HD-GYP domain-containing protein (c-di-GMP phosphodiesterase class II)
MYIKNEISIFDFVNAISETADLLSPLLNNHHKIVANLAGSIALEMNLPNAEIQHIVLAAMLHDIGAFTLEERLNIMSFESNENDMKAHAWMGYRLLKDFRPLSKAAELIEHHHADYDRSNEVPIGSYIISLADRVAVLFDERCEILTQLPLMLDKLFTKCHKFHPDVFYAFLRLVRLEYVWVQAFSLCSGVAIPRALRFPKEIIDLETLRDYAKVVAQIIDFRSRFTAAHSSGVSAIAKEFALISGFSHRECELMEIAGLLHDLGKLAVPIEVLEKKDALSHEEFNAIKKHAYYTYAVLNRVKGLEDIAEWAAYHHERQDGSGYPFHVHGENFSRPAHLMAAADIIAALTEDRPFRPKIDIEEAVEIVSALSENNGIDKSIVELANKNLPRLNDARIKAQEEALKEYEALHSVLSSLPPRLCASA